MTNPYLGRLRDRAGEKQHPSQPSKPSKPGFEGFEGDQSRRFIGSETTEDAKKAFHRYPQNLQNPRSPSVPVCAVCGATVDLWNYGEALVHRECASRLPKAEAAGELTLAYQQVSAEPDSAGCSVTIVEIPREAGRYKRTFAHLPLRPPALVPIERWRRCVEDGKRFLAKWGEQAQALGWTSADLFGLHMPPTNPRAHYRRLSRYDQTGLCWLLEGREGIALTEATVSIRNPNTRNVTAYRKHNKPALGSGGRFV